MRSLACDTCCRGACNPSQSDEEHGSPRQSLRHRKHTSRQKAWCSRPCSTVCHPEARTSPVMTHDFAELAGQGRCCTSASGRETVVAGDLLEQSGSRPVDQVAEARRARHARDVEVFARDRCIPAHRATINRKSSSSHRSALSVSRRYRSFSIAWLHCAQRFGLAVPYGEFPPMSNSEIRHRVIHRRQLQLLTTTQQNSQTLVGLWRRVSSAHCAHTCVTRSNWRVHRVNSIAVRTHGFTYLLAAQSTPWTNV